MRIAGTTGERYAERVLRTTVDAFVELRGADAVDARAREIAALDSKMWRGRRVYALRCNGDFGKGPHVQFVPEYLLWSLISLDNWRCPFHS